MRARKMLCLARPMLAACCLIWALGVSDVSAVAANVTTGQTGSETTVLDALVDDGRFETAVTVLQQTGLAGERAADGPFILFAPTDFAFEGLPGDELDRLLASPDMLEATLRHHIISGNWTTSELAQMGSATTALGTALTLIQHGDELMVDGTIVERGRVEASNGVVYVINRVLVPPARAQSLVEATAPTAADLVLSETKPSTTGTVMPDSPDVTPMPGDTSEDGSAGLLSGAAQLPVLAILLLLLAGGTLAILRRQG